jgi:SAM-dependent methyltransferase
MKLKEWINCEGAALDVGSFIGGFCSNLNKLGFDAYGLESQDRAVAFARDNGLNVFHGSFSRSIPTELLNVKFSFVSLMESIYYIVDLKETFLRIYEILKQDGYLLIQTINARSEFYEKNSLFVRYGDYVQEYPSLDSLQFWLHKSGFSIVRLTALPVYHINKLFQININVLGDMTQRLGALLHMCHNIYKCDIERADKLVLLAKRN